MVTTEGKKMTSGERYKIFKEWFNSIGFPEMHSSYKDATWQGFEAGYCKASNVNSAAPELLEALQETIHEVGHWLSTQKPELKEKIESAINKALGE